MQKSPQNKKKVVKRHSKWPSQGGNKVVRVEQINNYYAPESQTAVCGNILTWRIRVIYYEILHRTLLSYTVLLKSSLNYSTIILRHLKEKTHLYMWNQPKCQSKIHKQCYEKNYPHKFIKFPDIPKIRPLTCITNTKKHATLDIKQMKQGWFYSSE